MDCSSWRCWCASWGRTRGGIDTATLAETRVGYELLDDGEIDIRDVDEETAVSMEAAMQPRCFQSRKSPQYGRSPGRGHDIRIFLGQLFEKFHEAVAILETLYMLPNCQNEHNAVVDDI